VEARRQELEGKSANLSVSSSFEYFSHLLRDLYAPIPSGDPSAVVVGRSGLNGYLNTFQKGYMEH